MMTIIAVKAKMAQVSGTTWVPSCALPRPQGQGLWLTLQAACALRVAEIEKDKAIVNEAQPWARAA